MPRVRIEMPDFDQRPDATREGGRQRQTQQHLDTFARIDTDVFRILSGTWGLQRCGLQPRIESWVECWSSFER